MPNIKKYPGANECLRVAMDSIEEGDSCVQDGHYRGAMSSYRLACNYILYFCILSAGYDLGVVRGKDGELPKDGRLPEGGDCERFVEDHDILDEHVRDLERGIRRDCNKPMHEAGEVGLRDAESARDRVRRLYEIVEHHKGFVSSGIRRQCSSARRAMAGSAVARVGSVASRVAAIVVLGPIVIALALLALHATACRPPVTIKDAKYGNFVERDGGMHLAGLGTVKGGSYELPSTVESSDGRTWKVTGIEQFALDSSNVTEFTAPDSLDPDEIYYGLESSKVETVYVPNKALKKAFEESNPYQVDDEGMKVVVR